MPIRLPRLVTITRAAITSPAAVVTFPFGRMHVFEPHAADVALNLLQILVNRVSGEV